MDRADYHIINTALASMATSLFEKRAKMLSTLGRKIKGVAKLRKSTSVRSVASGKITGRTRGVAAALPKTKVRAPKIKAIRPVRKPRLPKPKMPKAWWLKKLRVSGAKV